MYYGSKLLLPAGYKPLYFIVDGDTAEVVKDKMTGKVRRFRKIERCLQVVEKLNNEHEETFSK